MYKPQKIIVFIIFFTICTGVNNVNALDCINCHKDVKVSGKHGNDNNINCESCHKNLDVSTHLFTEVDKVDCNICHNNYTASMKNDIHNRLYKHHKVSERLPDCKACHGYHSMLSPSESQNKEQDFCAGCHDNVLLVAPFHSTKFIADKFCIQCHADNNAYKTELANSMHSKFACADCHNRVVNSITEHTSDKEFGQMANCFNCHKTQSIKHADSIHGLSLRKGINESAQCWDCHGSHGILPVTNVNSKVNSVNLAKTCGDCHDNPKIVEKYAISAKSPGKTYTQSVQ